MYKTLIFRHITHKNSLKYAIRAKTPQKQPQNNKTKAITEYNKTADN